MLTDFYAKIFGTFEYKRIRQRYVLTYFTLMKGGDYTMAAKKKAKKKVAKKKVAKKKK